MTIEDGKVNLSERIAKFAGRYIASVKLRHVYFAARAASADTNTASGVPRGLGWRGGSNTPSRNSEGSPKSCQTQPDCENC